MLVVAVHFLVFRICFLTETGVHNLFNMKDTLNVTGGGAFKFEKLLKERLNVAINKLDEMKMLVDGLNFVLSHVQNEVFTYSHETKKQTFVPPKDEAESFPYLLVNIGSGVSILKVESKDEFHRVSGSSIGGGTFWGLACQMAGVTTWDEVHEMSISGDNRNIDLLVGDIYGTGYDKLGLDANVIASSFGKAGFRHENCDDAALLKPEPACVSSQLNAKTEAQDAEMEGMTTNNAQTQAIPTPKQQRRSSSASASAASPNASRHFIPRGGNSNGNANQTTTAHTEEDAQKGSAENNINSPDGATATFNPADIVKSLLFMICNNIGQVAYLNAKVHQVKRVYFAGGFIQRNPFIWSTLSFAIKFWSKGDMEAMFLVHDGYLGALGALLANPPSEHNIPLKP